MQHNDNWIFIGIVAFIAGIVSNIVKPKRRGLLGFAAAGIIGIFCGGIAGVCSVSFGITVEGQIFIAAIVGISSDRLLTFLLCDRITNNQYNSGNATGVQGNQNSIED